MWSIGVIIHLMLSGSLPFDSSEEKEIAVKTIYNEISFSHKIWDSVSDKAKSLILRLLEKDRRKRMTLNELLETDWIAGANKKLIEMRRKSSDSGNKI